MFLRCCLKVKYGYLTFDCYGTLVDWRRGIENHLGELLKGKGAPSDLSVFPLYARFESEEETQYKSYREILSDTAIKVANYLRLPIAEKDAKAFAASVPFWPPFGDTMESLAELGERGYKRVILSNVDRDLLNETVSHNSLDIDGYVTAEDVGSYKPTFGHWNRFFEVYKASRDRTLHVAQSMYHDIVPCGKLGISTAWINRYSEAGLTNVKPTYILSDLRNLLKVLT